MKQILRNILSIRRLSILSAGLFALFAGPRLAAAEREIALTRDFGTLYGTLVVPDGPPAETVVVMIAGSGPTDRDCNNRLGIRTNAFRYLAEALEKAGIASLRYDKRGIAQSVYDDPERLSEVVFEDFVADAAAWVDHLAGEGFRKIVLLGHSEGATIALCAAQGNPRITAIIEVSGAGHPLDFILQGQLAQQLATTDPGLYIRVTGIIDALRHGKRVDDIPQPLTALFDPSVQPFLISAFRYDPCRLIAALDIPVLILQGDNDLQVPAAEADALADAQPRARKVVVKGMTHTLKKSDGRTLNEQLAAYTDSTLALAPELTEAVTEFIGAL